MTCWMGSTLPRRVVTFITAFRHERMLSRVVEQASLYSEPVVVYWPGVRQVTSTKLVDNVFSPHVIRLTEDHLSDGSGGRAYAVRATSLALGILPGDVLGFLDGSQMVSDPHVIPKMVALDDAVWYASRYFMWDDAMYRNDGPFVPRRVPVFGLVGRSLSWDSIEQVAPNEFFERERWREAPFDIQDFRFLDDTRREKECTSFGEYTGKVLA